MNKNFDLDNINIEELVSNRALFDEFVHTPLEDAIYEHKKRWEDKKLEEKVSKFLDYEIPEPLKIANSAVIFRQVCTPNYELVRFFELTSKYNLNPILWEYYEDKFTTNNPIKCALGKVRGQKVVGKKNGIRVESVNVIEFNKNNGKKIDGIKTYWGQSLVDFHHELLEKYYPKSKQFTFDSSSWLHGISDSARGYYFKYTLLFVRHGILFENFCLEGEELTFVRDIFLPEYISVWKKTGIKPIIVAVLPTDIQDENFWYYYPFEVLSYIKNKLVGL